uniref:NIM-2 protein n=1 Tax=Plectus sambesii TaxID=2011161 RepID=A0A914X0D7_9BILA
MQTLAIVVLTFLALGSWANICTTPDGHWSFEVASGVIDFATGGVPLNKRYFCFDGCLNTHTALQNYKVKLINSSKDAVAKKVERTIDVLDFIKNNKRVSKIQDDDPQALFCQDPRILNIVKSTIESSPIDNCTNIVHTVVLKLARAGWGVVCTKLGGQTGGFEVNSAFKDYAFCDYTDVRPSTGSVYNVKVAQIDRS